MAKLLLAEAVTVLARADGVFLEFRDADNEVFAVAGFEVVAAVHFNGLVIAACERVLAGLSPSEAVH